MTDTKYKTEKRKALVGERILITNVSEVEDEYENGDVFEVAFVNSNCSVVNTERDIILDYEYEVIVGEHTPTLNLYEMDYDELVALVEDAMKAIKTQSYKLGYDQGRFDADTKAAHGTYEETDQKIRDEVVAQAKEDVRYILNSDYEHAHEFIVNIAKRTVVDLRKIKGCTNIVRRGIAKCAPNDCFNVHIGKAIALRRSLGWSVPAEYLNVPQPTEVRVGDVVRGRTAFSMRTYEETVEKIEDGKYKYIGGEYDYIDDADLVVIDDSRAGKGE
ncbi:hypothetical protein [Bacillus sp. FSL K6-2839]|uniref:hypothetical protein n=1 Tax=Bacillus sp. FSL K6-2839 TaxID=2921480 RepID=UPI0030FA2897